LEPSEKVGSEGIFLQKKSQIERKMQPLEYLKISKVTMDIATTMMPSESE
jgi:hypothetical protein